MGKNYFHGDEVVKAATKAGKWYRKALLRSGAYPLNDESLGVRTLTLLSELYWLTS